MKDEQVRLQKHLSACGLASRRKAEEYITEGRVKVNSIIVTELGTKVNPKVDKILVDNQPLTVSNKVIYLFNKPKGVLTTMYDPRNRPTVGDYSKKLPQRVFPVGRLDFDVFGLLLLTNDGDYGQRVLHPSYGVTKTYWAEVEGEVSDRAIGRLYEGVELEDGLAKVTRARMLRPTDSFVQKFFKRKHENSSFIEIIISEGKKHIVKRILAGVGFPVLELCRVAFGNYILGDLPSGDIIEVDFK